VYLVGSLLATASARGCCLLWNLRAVLTPDAVLPAVCVASFLFYLLHQDLPEGWVEVPDEASGAVYYYNNNTGESLWERPTA